MHARVADYGRKSPTIDEAQHKQRLVQDFPPSKTRAAKLRASDLLTFSGHLSRALAESLSGELSAASERLFSAHCQPELYRRCHLKCWTLASAWLSQVGFPSSTVRTAVQLAIRPQDLPVGRGLRGARTYWQVLTDSVSLQNCSVPSACGGYPLKSSALARSSVRSRWDC